jgi:hypothetical protein
MENMKKNLYRILILLSISSFISFLYSITLNDNLLKVSLFSGIFYVSKLYLSANKVNKESFEEFASLLILPYIIVFPEKYIYLIIPILFTFLVIIYGKIFIKNIYYFTMSIIAATITPGSFLINIALVLFAGVFYSLIKYKSITKEIASIPNSILVIAGFSMSFAIVREIALNTSTNGVGNGSLNWIMIILLLIVIVFIFTKYVQILFPKLSTVLSLICIITLIFVVPYESFSNKLIKNLDSVGKVVGVEQSPLNNGAMTSEAGAGPRPQFNDITFEFCDEINSRDCFITFYDNLANKEGMKYALDHLVEKVRENKGKTFASHCHQTIHNLGQLAFELSDGDFQLVSSYDPQVCGTGFIHGLYERYFNDYGKYLFSMTGEICEKMNLLQNWYAWTCNHILGHTIMTKMMSDPNSASEYCNQLLSVNMHFRDCQAGAWMNFFADDTIINWFKKNAMNQPEKLFNICYGAETNSKYWCYQEIFPILLTISDNNVEKMAKWCKEYSEKPRGNGPIYAESALFFEERCIGGMARVLGVANGYDYRVIMSRCSSIEDQRQVDTCLTAGAASIVLNTGSVSAGIELCERVEDKGYREYCYIWIKQTGVLLASGPNSENMPKFGEIRNTENSYLIDLPEKKSKI